MAGWGCDQRGKVVLSWILGGGKVSVAFQSRTTLGAQVCLETCITLLRTATKVCGKFSK